jgi:opacity protein-like surface antigen
MRPILAVLVLLLSLATARADAVHDEIAHLIDFVRHSSCTFIRNGSEYDGNQAADHVQAKYDYYKSDIKTVEDFIERAASKSMLSGKAYEVRCADGKVMPAADWIRAEDTAYRARLGATAN